MERTNRPTQVGTRTPSGRQSRGTGQTAAGQDGHWADGLVREYDNKLSGRNPAQPWDGQGAERQAMAPGGTRPGDSMGGSGTSVAGGVPGDSVTGGGQGVPGNSAARGSQGGSAGRLFGGSGGQQGGRDAQAGQLYGRNARERTESQAHGGNGYRQEQQAFGTGANRQGGRMPGDGRDAKTGQASGGAGRRVESAPREGRERQGAGGYGTGPGVPGRFGQTAQDGQGQRGQYGAGGAHALQTGAGMRQGEQAAHGAQEQNGGAGAAGGGQRFQTGAGMGQGGRAAYGGGPGRFGQAASGDRQSSQAARESQEQGSQAVHGSNQGRFGQAMHGGQGQSGQAAHGSQGQSSQTAFGGQGQSGEAAFGGRGQSGEAAFGDQSQRGQAAFGGRSQSGQTAFGGQSQSGQTALGGQGQSGQTALGGRDQRGQAAFGGRDQSSQTAFGGQGQRGQTAFGSRGRFGPAAQGSAGRSGGASGNGSRGGTGGTEESDGGRRGGRAAPESKRQRKGGTAGEGRRRPGGESVAGNGASGKRQGGGILGTGGRRGGAASKPKGNGRHPAGGKDRRPPGTAQGKKGRWGIGKGKAAGLGRAGVGQGQAYETAGSSQKAAESLDTGKAGRPAVRVPAKKPPGFGAKTGKKPGSGINFLVQGSILAAAGIVVRLIGMVYRIPLAKKIGDVGNGYYNAAYSIYSILLIMSSYSLPTAVSKMVSARLAKGQYRTSTKIFRASMFYATAAGLAGFCALWFGADYFASEIIKMPYSSYALKSLAPTIWIMAYLGVLRGYFQGHSTMIPTAVSQVFEQVVNAVVSIVAASVLFDMGVKSNLVFHDTEYSYAFGAAGGAIGTGAGALTALVLFLLLTMGYVPTMRKQAKRDRGSRVESYGAISRALLVTIVPIIISSAIYNISNVVDNSIFGHVMEGLGESGQTASHWGVYMGRYHMLFNIPVAIANSLSSSLIPSLSRAAAEKDRREILSKIGSAIRFSMIIAIPSAVGLAVLAGPVSNLLFSGMNNEMLIRMMALGSSAVVFFSLSTVSNAILQGINRMQVPIINSAVSLGAHVGVLYVMLGVFHMGIYSVVYANILFAALVCVLNAISIARYSGYRQEIVKTFLIPCAASAAMGGAAWGTYELCAKAGNAVSTAAAIFVAVAVYFVLLLKLKGVDAQELRGMPGGTRIFKAARKLRLM